VLLLALTVLRKSMPLVLRSEVRRLIASEVHARGELASRLCGAPVDSVIAADAPPANQWPERHFPWAKVELLTWRPVFPMSGRVLARVSGVGVDHQLQPLGVKTCDAVLEVSFAFTWEDNGRSVSLRGQMTEPPRLREP